jgi:hypothetical protein
MKGNKNIARKTREHKIPPANSEIPKALATHEGKFIRSIDESLAKTGLTELRIKRKKRGEINKGFFTLSPLTVLD